MNKVELIEKMSESSGLSKKDADCALKAFLEAVSSELLKGGDVQISGFGTFSVTERSAREGKNPATGETMQIAAARTPKFRPGKALKDKLNKK